MINIITGRPRSGKSYLSVWWIKKNYVVFNPDLLQQEVKEDTLLITNIDSLRLPHKNFDDMLRQNNLTVEQFFTDAIQKGLSEKYACIIYILDECHRYFPDDFYKKPGAKECLDYFAYHGHYNQHFWLITQDVSLIWNKLIRLGETEFRAMSQSTRPPGYFKWVMLVPGTKQKQGNILKRHDKKVFALYKTAYLSETEKPSSNKRYAIFIGCIVFGFGLMAYSILSWLGGPSKATASERKGYKTAKAGKPFESRKAQRIYSKPAGGKNQNFQKKWTQLSFYTIGEKIYILDPAFQQFILVNQADFPVKIVTRGLKTTVYGQLETENTLENKDGFSS